MTRFPCGLGFDPDLQYQLDQCHGKCQMKLDGDRDTRFTLTQFQTRVATRWRCVEQAPALADIKTTN